MKRFATYRDFLNEGMFDFIKKKPKKPSDDKMKELISDIKSDFDITKLKWTHSDMNDSDLSWTYKIDKDNEINIRFYSRGSRTFSLSINHKSVSLTQVSEYLLHELSDFFFAKEKEQRIKDNSNLFDKVSKVRKETEKYNL